MNRERGIKLDHILVTLDVNDSSRKVELRIFCNMVMESEIRVHDGCLNSVANMEAPIRSNVVPDGASPPRSPESPRALPELGQLLFGKEQVAVIFLICFTAVPCLCYVGFAFFRYIVPINKFDLVTVHYCDF